MTPQETVVIGKAFETALKRKLKEARAEVDAELWSAYDEEGYKKKELRLNGETMGELILAMNKPHFEITDKSAFDEFALDYGLGYEQQSIKPEMMHRAISLLSEVLSDDEIEQYIDREVIPYPSWDAPLVRVGDNAVLSDSGLLVPGVSYVPETPKNTMIRGCKPEDVFPVVGELGGIDGFLLGGGDE